MLLMLIVKEIINLLETNNLLKNNLLTITHSVQSILKKSYYEMNQKLFEPGNLN